MSPLSLLPLVTLLLAPITSVSATTVGWPYPTRDICTILDHKIPGRVGFPNTSVYNFSQASYYTTQESGLEPGCVFRPQKKEEISTFLKLINPFNDSRRAAKFAVRSGGHMFFAGAANIQGGVTVDMRAFNSVVVSKDRKLVSVGGGAVFSSDVYPHLSPQNLTVIGGRFPGIAVGGFTTGGGINFLSRKYGWSCDTIYGYEVVLASGEIVYATANQYSDLWLALKGGSFNYGIVTRFDMAAFPLEGMWAGLVTYNYTEEAKQGQANAFAEFMKPKNFDGLADITVQIIFQAGQFFMLDGIFYSAPTPFPKTFKPFTDLPHNEPTSLGLTDISDFVAEFGQILPAQVPRAYEVTYAYRNTDAATYRQLIKIWEDTTLEIANVTGFQSAYLFQPLPVTNGTNALGLPVGVKDLVLGAISAAYENPADEAIVNANLKKVMDLQVAVLKQQGKDLPFIYLNYGNPPQDAFTSYGKKNKDRLWKAAKKYDPQGIFQIAAPGGWKLSKSAGGAPVSHY